jgi:hypothetical protein
MNLNLLLQRLRRLSVDTGTRFYGQDLITGIQGQIPAIYPCRNIGLRGSDSISGQPSIPSDYKKSFLRYIFPIQFFQDSSYHIAAESALTEKQVKPRIGFFLSLKGRKFFPRQGEAVSNSAQPDPLALFQQRFTSLPSIPLRRARFDAAPAYSLFP